MELIDLQENQDRPMQKHELKQELKQDIVQPLSEYFPNEFPSQKFILNTSTMSQEFS